MDSEDINIGKYLFLDLKILMLFWFKTAICFCSNWVDRKDCSFSTLQQCQHQETLRTRYWEKRKSSAWIRYSLPQILRKKLCLHDLVVSLIIRVCWKNPRVPQFHQQKQNQSAEVHLRKSNTGASLERSELKKLQTPTVLARDNFYRQKNTRSASEKSALTCWKWYC